jgi:biopolymer transport protein ExbD
MKMAVMDKTTRTSPLAQAQFLKPGAKSSKHGRHDLALALPLTSLIDAFSIIVIYLLIGTQSGALETTVPNNLKLPMAEAGQTIEGESLNVRIEKGIYFINDKPVAMNQLGQKLVEAKKASGNDNIQVVIQADTKMDYADLDPLLRAGSEAGLQKLKFAVMPTK